MNADVAQTIEPRRRSFNSLSLREQCCILCRDRDFQDWLFAEFEWLKGGDATEAAAVIVKAKLGIASRKELDTDERAAETWKVMRLEFEMAAGRLPERRGG